MPTTKRAHLDCPGLLFYTSKQQLWQAALDGTVSPTAVITDVAVMAASDLAAQATMSLVLDRFRARHLAEQRKTDWKGQNVCRRRMLLLTALCRGPPQGNAAVLDRPFNS